MTKPQAAGDSLLNLTIEKLVPRGDGLARSEGKVIFLPMAAPGDRVEARITEEKKSYSRAEILRVLEASSQRQEPFCPHYGVCGGCNLQHIRYDQQLLLKEEMLRDGFQRIASVDLPELKIHSAKDQHYRNRVQFHRAEDHRWGFKQRGSNQVIPLDQCPLLVHGLNRFLSNPPAISSDIERLRLFGNEKNFWFDPDETIQMDIAGKSIQFNNRCFFQSNLQLLESFISSICSQEKGHLFLDLYGGVGLFSLFLKEHFHKGILVESNRQAAPWVKKNAGVTVEFIGKPLERWNRKKTDKPDFAVIDPPRSGMAPKALDNLFDWGIPHVCYVSCDPMTLARDTAKILKKGYRITESSLFDFYPHSSHMEMVIHFSL